MVEPKSRPFSYFTGLAPVPSALQRRPATHREGDPRWLADETEQAQAVVILRNRRRASGTHTAVISRHQATMAGTGWSSCQEPLE
jgi:hypothetical protein